MSQSPQPLPSKLANAPFDDPRADIVLRSSDGVDFHVFELILSLASPVFADMSTLPSPAASSQNSGDERDELSVVQLTEEAETLDMALRYCYPVPSPEVITLHDAHALLEFARKYQVDVIRHSLTRFLTDTIKRNPSGIYALASAYEYQDIAVKALRSCLMVPIYQLHSPELQHSTTREQYEALIYYHISCGRVASAVSMRRKWIPGECKITVTSPQSFGCAVCIMPDFIQPDAGLVTRFGPRYLWNYLHRSALVLAYHPNADAVTEEAFVLKDMKCRVCETKKKLEMLECSRAFAAEVRRVVKQVPLPIIGREGNINDTVLALLSQSDKLDLTSISMTMWD